ncbi:MAG: Sapep family Mn(2+)-dependent dipeptidase [Clostridiales Family XIII bacterium]|jgi:succinyl-diaminopimelate desuccinylase|nr:Sapep family Mn(2+)-dependent dipeptidase [Clostridiales Family XIII bacterium]
MNYKEILDSYRDEVVGTLRELVSFQSVKAAPAGAWPFGEEVQKAYAYMLAKAERDGFDTFNADNYGGHIEWPGAETDERGEIIAAADETLGIPVHLDVVPLGDGWTHDPWGGEDAGEIIYGRGTTDNKGAAACVYYAMKVLKEAGYVPAKNIRLILGLDEETGWSGMDKYLEQASPPDFGFSPDADFPVINGEMGMMVFEIAKKLEPGRESGLFLRSMAGGSAPNMVPDNCRAILVYEDGLSGKGGKSKKSAKRAAQGKDAAARDKVFASVKEAVSDFRGRTGAKISCKGVGSALEVSVHGVSAHGSRPEKGVNAITALMDFLGGIGLANESARDFVDFYNTQIGYETDGKSLGIAMGDGPSGPLIVNTGMIGLSREAAILTVNVRYPVSKKEEDVYDALRPAIDSNGLGVVKISGMAPLYYAPDEPFVGTLLAVYRENTGDTESLPVVMGGGTYARAIPRAVAFGPRFPDDEEVMHQKDEFVSIPSLMKAAHIYADAICRLTQRGSLFGQARP